MRSHTALAARLALTVRVQVERAPALHQARRGRAAKEAKRGCRGRDGLGHGRLNRRLAAGAGGARSRSAQKLDGGRGPSLGFRLGRSRARADHGQRSLWADQVEHDVAAVARRPLARVRAERAPRYGVHLLPGRCNRSLAAAPQRQQAAQAGRQRGCAARDARRRSAARHGAVY